MTERGEELLALWNEFDALSDQKDSVAASTVLTVLTVFLVLLGLDGGSVPLLLGALLPGAIAGTLIARDVRRTLRKGRLRRRIEADHGPAPGRLEPPQPPAGDG